MNPPKKLSTRQQAAEQHAQSEQQSQHETVREFATVEEMLRDDAVHTSVPPSIARRLQESVSQLAPPPPRAWWRRLFGR